MFKFGFSYEDSENDTNGQTNSLSKESPQWIESNKIHPHYKNVNESLSANSINCGDFSIKYITNEEVIRTLKSSCNNSDLLLNIEQSHSDLITSVYEGGLKVWECTYDVLKFINDHNLDLDSKKVLDLGCGAGIIGIFASLKGATTVFQDYNVEVINQVTIPNVVLNRVKLENCAFYCGDWQSFVDILKPQNDEDEKFDYIFTSETIYNKDNYTKLMNIFTNLLKKTGVIYLAAKYYYFGVGGGIPQFEDMLKKYNTFNSSTCWICSEGVKRAIIKITFK